MKTVCLYFQVHQPWRLKKYRFFNMGKDHNYLDDLLNRSIMQKVARQCYLPMNALLLKLIKENKGKFRCSFSITGIAVEQFRAFAPEVLDSFKELAATGCVEFLAETYSHSLASLASKEDFTEQVKLHTANMISTEQKGQVLAIGGELKNSFCIGVDNRFYLSPYIGDLEDLRTVKALKETVERMETLLEVEPSIAVCDLHPKYNSTVVAEEMGLPLLKVQHHYAHILSCMAENDCQEPVIGVSFDGTGYGTDGTIWGGEILLCDYRNFHRIGSI